MGFYIKPPKAEALGPTTLPFKVIDQTPVEVTFDTPVKVCGAPYLVQVLDRVTRMQGVLVIFNAIFGNNNGQFITVCPFQGLDVLLVSVQKMLQHLHGGRADGSWDRRLLTYLRPDLLILDDFGLKPIPSPGPEDLYDVINERYKHGSILLTSNRAPNEWADLFMYPLLASAGLDRLLDRAEVIIIRGPSFCTQGRSRLLEEVKNDPVKP